MQVLIVEDERNIRFMLWAMLQPLGYKVIEAADGQQALQCLRDTEGITLMVTDVRMPGMTGIQLLEKVRMQYPKLQVIVISAYADQAQEAMKKGANAYLPKPFTRTQLINAVKQVTGQQIHLPPVNNPALWSGRDSRGES